MIVPPNPGVTSALGCLLVDVRHDLSEMYRGRADEVDAGEVEEAFARLEEEARERLAAEGVARGPHAPPARRSPCATSASGARWRSRSTRRSSRSTRSSSAFHAEHEREYSYRREDAPVEIYQLACTRSA